jgi:aminoglycoside phosphotransferase (APT) family kinase protein
VLTLADGSRVFAKAAPVTRSPFTVKALRDELRVLAVLPETVPAPRLRWSHDDGEWVVVVMDAVDGRNPAQPWVGDELARFLEAAVTLAASLAAVRYPAPVFADLDDFSQWSAFAADEGAAARLEAPVRARVGALAALESGWSAATAGDALVHGDFRADNLLLTATGFVVVDWPAVSRGAGWLDLLISLPSVAMHGGGDPEALWQASPLSAGVDPDAVNAVLAGIAGYFIERSQQPADPLLPTIRDFQRVQGEVALGWLGDRLGWRD